MAYECPGLKYHGYTYFGFLSRFPFKWLWKKICCKRKWHLWDEVATTGCNPSTNNNYMVCDVCGETIAILPYEEEIPVMTIEEFRSFLFLLISADPWPGTSTTRETLINWANQEAKNHGYEDWVDAYHHL